MKILMVLVALLSSFGAQAIRKVQVPAIFVLFVRSFVRWVCAFRYAD